MSSILRRSEMQKIDKDIRDTVFGYVRRVERHAYGLNIPIAIKLLVIEYYNNNNECDRCDGMGVYYKEECSHCNNERWIMTNCRFCAACNGTGIGIFTGYKGINLAFEIEMICTACDGTGKWRTECTSCLVLECDGCHEMGYLWRLDRLGMIEHSLQMSVFHHCKLLNEKL